MFRLVRHMQTVHQAQQTILSNFQTIPKHCSVRYPHQLCFLIALEYVLFFQPRFLHFLLDRPARNRTHARKH